MDSDHKATPADVAAMEAWTAMGTLLPQDSVGAKSTYGDGRIILPAPTAESAREVEERARAREERHAEGRARILRAMGGSLNLSHAVGVGPWASSMRGRPSPDEAGGDGQRGDPA